MMGKNHGRGARVRNYLAIALTCLAFGQFTAACKDGAKTDGATAEGASAKPADAKAAFVDSDKLPVGSSAVLGKEDALITVVEFSDFQCPFCSRGGSTVKELQKKYPDDVRVVFKHFPLAFHKEAPGASKAAMAAGMQGKFWEMHDLLFENQKQMKGADMKELGAGFAKQLGLDVEKFKADFDKPELDQTIKDDMALGQKNGVRGTPHFFINGERLSGAQPIAKFEEVVKKQLEEAKKLETGGTKRGEIYAKMVETNLKAAPAPAQQNAKPQAARVELVPVSKNDPAKGNTKNPLVTIVEFSDFQCPFCSRVNPTLDEVMKKYGDDVRVVFKQNPLPFHKEAPAAAKASLAAHKQGKFWEMHDLLFQENKSWKGQDMDALTEGYAQKLGLNVKKFKKAYADEDLDKQVKEDMALATKVGARGTPNFFINGVNLVGAKPFPAFEAEIKKQLEIAKKLKAEKKLDGDKLYEEVVAYNKKNAPKVAAPAAAAPPAAKVDPSKLKIGNAAVKGSKKAPVTIFEFSDFQCPYCSRGNSTIQQVLKEYDGKVQVVFKAFPLPFHKEAEPAHRAAIAAGKQGKFWEMHDKFFGDQKAIKDLSNIDKYASEIGLNMDKFKKDFESDEVKKQVQDEMAEGREVGVRGTPAFFINGTRLVGAQPIEKFKSVIDEELKKK